ncbi:hypothetical protein GCM10027403_12480 [Arthrobacter tecti]
MAKGGGTPTAVSDDMRSGEVTDVPPGRRLVRWTVVIVVCLLAGAGIGWAGAVALRPAEDAVQTAAFTTVEVVPGEVSSSLSLNTVTSWPQSTLALNQASGVVTSVQLEPGAEVSVGDALYSVNLTPVVAAEGTVPSFRPLALGDVGEDVRQVETMLIALGYLQGEPADEYTARTQTAVSAWQTERGEQATGVIAAGSIVFVPDLPRRLMLNTEVISRGLPVAGGEVVVYGIPAAPDFTVPLQEGQTGTVQPGLPVNIRMGESVWQAQVQEVRSDPENGVEAVLAPTDDGTICGDECTQVPVGEDTLLPSELVIVPSTEGLVVPAAALITGADGAVAVVDGEGATIPVQVTETANGMAVITGVTAGTMVRIAVPQQATP